LSPTIRQQRPLSFGSDSKPSSLMKLGVHD
jgi:hypothetical protein